MAGYGKKTFKQKIGSAKQSLSAAFKKALLVTGLVVAPLGGAGWYQYGTVQEREVRITSVEKTITGYNQDWWGNIDFNNPTYEASGYYRTSGGRLKNENSALHLKFNSDEIGQQLQEGKIYRIRYYGRNVPLPKIGLTPNILSIDLVTEQELQAREAAKTRAAEAARVAQERQDREREAAAARTAAAPVAANNNQPAGTTSTRALSGEVTTIEQVVNGYRVQFIVPIEAAGDVRVTTVRSLTVTTTPRPPAP